MVTKVRAVYSDGVFRPEAPLPVAEGARVELTVDSAPVAQSLVESLEEISRLPAAGAKDGFSGADHDRILYPDHKEV
jgi:predicted DNA-binding antitoxin AbrB/MazE fold protein